MRRKDRLEEVKKWYRRFKHNLECKEGYSKKVIITIISLLILDLILLYFVW